MRTAVHANEPLTTNEATDHTTTNRNHDQHYTALSTAAAVLIGISLLYHIAGLALACARVTARVTATAGAGVDHAARADRAARDGTCRALDGACVEAADFSATVPRVALAHPFAVAAGVISCAIALPIAVFLGTLPPGDRDGEVHGLRGVCGARQGRARCAGVAGTHSRVGRGGARCLGWKRRERGHHNIRCALCSEGQCRCGRCGGCSGLGQEDAGAYVCFALELVHAALVTGAVAVPCEALLAHPVTARPAHPFGRRGAAVEELVGEAAGLRCA